ncbi:hypothetical protein Vretifemale_2031 [Volvox reticuliferus]|nr:hypothetical protein Vretifemale_2031 [Volvox reticuliferus]
MPKKNKHGPDTDETCQGTDRNDGASRPTAAANPGKLVPQQAMEEPAAWGSLISSEAQHPSLSLFGGRACLWQDSVTGSLSLVPGSTQSQQLCLLEVQKPGPTGGQPLAVLSAVSSHAVQLDGKTLAAGERVPLRSGSELCILPSASTSPGPPERRSYALFLFMPANLAAYNDCTGAAGGGGSLSGTPPNGAEAVTGPVATSAVVAIARSGGSGDGCGDIEQGRQGQAAYPAALLESLLQRASLGAGRGSATTDDVCFTAGLDQPFRRPLCAQAGLQLQRQCQQQDGQYHQQQRQSQGQGKGQEGWTASSRHGMPSHLLRALQRAGHPGVPTRWQLAAALAAAREGASAPWRRHEQLGAGGSPVASDRQAGLRRRPESDRQPAGAGGGGPRSTECTVAATAALSNAARGLREDVASPVMQRLKRLRAAMAAAGLTPSVLAQALPRPLTQQQNQCRDQQAAAASTSERGNRSGTGSIWEDLARLGQSISAAAAVAAAAGATAGMEPEPWERLIGHQTAAPEAAERQPPGPEQRSQAQPHHSQTQQPAHAEAAMVGPAGTDNLLDELLRACMMDPALGSASDQDDIATTAAAAVAGLRDSTVLSGTRIMPPPYRVADGSSPAGRARVCVAQLKELLAEWTNKTPPGGNAGVFPTATTGVTVDGFLINDRRQGEGLRARVSASSPASPNATIAAAGCVRAETHSVGARPLPQPRDVHPHDAVLCGGSDAVAVATDVQHHDAIGRSALLPPATRSPFADQLPVRQPCSQVGTRASAPPSETFAERCIGEAACTATASDGVQAGVGDQGAGLPLIRCAEELQRALGAAFGVATPGTGAAPPAAALPWPTAQMTQDQTSPAAAGTYKLSSRPAACAAHAEASSSEPGLQQLPAATEEGAVVSRLGVVNAEGSAAADNNGGGMRAGTDATRGDGAGANGVTEVGGLVSDLAADGDSFVADILTGLLCRALASSGEAAGTRPSPSIAAPDTVAATTRATTMGPIVSTGSEYDRDGDKPIPERQGDGPRVMDSALGGPVAGAGAEEGLPTAMDVHITVATEKPSADGPPCDGADLSEGELLAVTAMDASPAALAEATGVQFQVEQQDATEAAAPAPQASQPQTLTPTAAAVMPQSSDPMRKRVAAFKAELAACALTHPEALTIRFDNMPYYLGSGTKERLMATALLHLRHCQFASFTADLAPMSPRVLLCGSFGSELYQQAIVSCVAASCGAHLLVFDRVALGLEGDGLGPAGLPGVATSAGLGESAEDGRDVDLDFDDDDDCMDLGIDPSRFASRWQPSGLKRRRLLGFFGGATGPGGEKPPGVLGTSATGEKPMGVVSGNVGRGGTAGSEKGPNGPRPFRKGDRVRFWGSGGSVGSVPGLPSALSSALLGGLSGYLSSMGQRIAARAASDAVGSPGGGAGPSSGVLGGARGPNPGSTGRVVLAFDDNPKKVGVRFDTPVPGGLDLGGACEEGFGYFCLASDLLLEGSRLDEEAEGAAVGALFELAAETAANGPVVIHFRDAERAVVGSSERFSRVRRALDSLPPGVLVIASYAPRSAGAGRGLGVCLGGSWPPGGGPRLHGTMEPMLLLDPMFGRLADKVRGIAGSDDPRDTRSVRALLKVFPNRITLHAPHGEPAASEWQAALERDVGTLRERANRRALAGLMSRCGIECTDLETVVIRDQALSAEAVERVVGWAVAAAVQRASAAATGPETVGKSVHIETPNLNDSAVLGPPPAVATGALSAPAASPPASAAAAPDSTPITAASTPGTVANDDLLLRGGQLQITAADVASAVATLKAVAAERVPPSKHGLQDVQLEGEFEKKLLAEVVPPEELGVSFDSIGALENVKETLREVVMLPLQRPELFTRGTLTKPTKGVLLFGPPGTGKTMLAKAVASECGANFLYVSLSSVTSKWFGEAEKYIKAVFTLAHKIAPSVIFVDEVDSLLGKRTGNSSEHEASRKMKNEFMAHWDGLKTRQKDRVMVLAATNRPMDLDEAVIRRMPRRIMVDLPDASNRVKILKVLLKDENLDPSFPLEELATLTEGYSGSDLKNMCVAAAYRPIRELIAAEKTAAEAARRAAGASDADGAKSSSSVINAGPAAQPTRQEVHRAGGAAAGPVAHALREPNPAVHSALAKGTTPDVSAAPAAMPQAPQLRALNLEDFKAAMQQVGPSVASDQGSLMNELRRWNEAYGEGGKRKVDTLTYFL